MACRAGTSSGEVSSSLDFAHLSVSSARFDVMFVGVKKGVEAGSTVTGCWKYREEDVYAHIYTHIMLKDICIYIYIDA